MKKTAKEKMALLLEWAKQTKENLERWGEEEFYELRNREKNAILDAIVKTELDYETDGDCDDVFLMFRVGKVCVTFQSGSADCAYPDDMRGELDDLFIEMDGVYLTIDDLINYLQSSDNSRMKFEIEYAKFTKVVIEADDEEEAKDMAAMIDGDDIAEHEPHDYKIWNITKLD